LIDKIKIKVMINLSVQDQVDGKGKIAELRGAIGQEFSDNRSSTSRSRLVAVSVDGNTCTVEEVRSEYNKREPKFGHKTQPSWLTWNSMFY
jgi:hypothetical protein